MLEQADHEFSNQLRKEDLLTPFSPIRKADSHASKNAFAYFPESLPTSESTSINSQFNLFHPAGVLSDPNKNVYDYRGPVPHPGGFSSSLNSSASLTDEPAQPLKA